MTEGEGGDVHVRLGIAQVRIAEEGAIPAFQGLAAERWKAAIGSPPVVEIFVAKVDPGVRRDQKADGRVETVALQLDMAAEAFAVFIDGVQPTTHPFAQGLVDVRAQAVTALAVDRSDRLVVRSQAGALGDAIDDPAAAAASEDHGIGAAQDLDAVHVVEITEILNVVTQAVAEEVGGGVVAAQGQLVAVRFSGTRRGTGHEQQQVGDGPQLLILNLAFGDDRQRLRDILDLRLGAGRSAGRLDAIFLTLAGDHDRVDIRHVDRVHTCRSSRGAGFGSKNGRGQDKQGRGAKQGASGNGHLYSPSERQIATVTAS